jgi:hypothetical protein
MNSRERLAKTLNHQQPDMVPLDLGATSQTGMSASTLYRLRKAMGLPEKPILVHEPAQILGYVDADVLKRIGADVIGLWNPYTFMGYKNENWKPWTMPDGTPTLMSGNFEYDVDEDGVTYCYPQGDRTAKPSMKIPAGGYFFDNIDRSEGFDEDDLDARRDFAEDFKVFDDETARYLERESKRLYDETEYGIVGMCGGGGFGDVSMIPGANVKNPRGIRKMEDWLVAHILYPDYILEVFELQAEVALKNLEIYKQAVGDRVQVVWISGTDFGTQNSEFMSKETYRKFYKPYQKRLNDWIHKNTRWKTFYHTCGSIVNLLDDMVEAGIDILNPVQCSAAGMDPRMLKEKYGNKLVFWGGGVDTQHVLPFGTPEEVRAQVRERLEIFSHGGGFVFNPIHNVVAKTPVENLLAMYETVNEFRAGLHFCL